MNTFVTYQYIYEILSGKCMIKDFKCMHLSPYVRESTKVLDSGSQPLDSGSQHLDSGFQPFGFRIPTFWIPDSIPKWIPDSNSKNLLDSGFRILLHGATLAYVCTVILPCIVIFYVDSLLSFLMCLPQIAEMPFSGSQFCSTAICHSKL